MRVRRINQSVWMYGFPTRKHHYTERALAKRHNVPEKYAELRYVEHHPNSSPYRGGSSSSSFSCNGNGSSSGFEQPLNSTDDVIPAPNKCQLHSRNGFIAQNNCVSDRRVNFENNIKYYGNVTGCQKYEGPSRTEFDPYTYPSTSGQNISAHRDDARINYHAPLDRSPTRYPEPTPLHASLVGSPLVGSKARFEWYKCNPKVDSKITTINCKSAATAEATSEEASTHPNVETSLLRAVKLEDTTILADLLNGEITEDVNATDASGRTVLSYLVMKNNLSLVERFVKTPGLCINKSDNEGNTPLHYTAQAGQVEALSLLLNSHPGVELDARNVFGFTPLMKAALQGRTKCAKLLLFAGASPTMRDTGKGLRAEQWARYCGRYICADVIEKYARNQLLSKTASYGNWGGEPELGLHFVNGRLQPPAISLQHAIDQNYKRNSIKSKLKKAFQHTNPNNWSSHSKTNSFCLVTQLTSAALCVSSPVLPNSSKVSPVVKSLIKPFVIPKIEITAEYDNSPEHSINSFDSADTSRETASKAARKMSYFVKLRKKSYFSNN